MIREKKEIQEQLVILALKVLVPLEQPVRQDHQEHLEDPLVLLVRKEQLVFLEIQVLLEDQQVQQV